jgi:hypothetical protein
LAPSRHAAHDSHNVAVDVDYDADVVATLIEDVGTKAIPPVLASLWSVGDESTAELMKRCYRHLREGATKDEALRAAQREMIQAGAHPFHWAAFQLSGDWR